MADARIARLVDFETSGLPEDEGAEIIEAARLDVDLTAEGFPVIAGSAFTTLCKPSGPIPPVTMAVHHITDEDVADAPPRTVAYQQLAAGLTDDDVYVAHNAAFEQHFYSKRPQKWICTNKCALRAWPDAPGHSNQALRYWLKFPLDRKLADPAHRALPDCYVTAEILRLLLAMRPVERLVEVSEQPALLVRFGFGKHAGKTFKEVAEADPSYLKWIVDKSDLDANVKFSARRYLRGRG